MARRVDAITATAISICRWLVRRKECDTYFSYTALLSDHNNLHVLYLVDIFKCSYYT